MAGDPTIISDSHLPITIESSDLGYDGGAFFSRDSQKIVWRASRPQGEAADVYSALLKDGFVLLALLAEHRPQSLAAAEVADD